MTLAELDEQGCTDCTSEGADNYDPTPPSTDGVFVWRMYHSPACNCNFDVTITNLWVLRLHSCVGCTDDEACNYDSGASHRPAYCDYPAANFDCDGNCLNDGGWRWGL